MGRPIKLTPAGVFWIGYPRLILLTYEPRYIAAGWGKGSCA